jgi:hypothetical protein
VANSASDYLKDLVGAPVTITSGHRTPERNRLVGGAPNSAHLKPGQAYDFVPNGISTKDAADRIAKSGNPFDQVYDEGDHVHVSFAPTNRRQVIPSKMAGPSDSDILAALTGKSPAPAKASGDSSKPSVPADGGGPSDDQILAALTGGAPKATPSAAPPAAPNADHKPPPNTLLDVLKSADSGFVKGVAATAGLPGDTLNILMKSVGIPTREGPLPSSVTAVVPGGGAYGGAQELAKLTEPEGGYHKPETRAGKFANTIAQFAPAALAPGNALLRTARVVVPGAASEAGGEMFEGTPMEGPARLVGALAGGLGISRLRGQIGGVPKPTIPTTAEIKAASQQSYKAAEQAGVVVKQSAVKSLASQISQDVNDAGIDPTLHPKATAALKRIVDSTGDLTLKKLDILRRVANGAAGSIDKDEARVAHVILDHIDDFVENLRSGDILSGDPKRASDAIKNARSLWAKQAKSDTIDTLFERAKNRAETVSGSGFENALRVEFRGLAQNTNRMARFTPDEQDAIRKVARGGPLGNVARTLGKLAPTNLIAMLSEMGAIAHDPKALALPVIGAAGRMAATAMTKNAANKASEMVRSGGVKQTAQLPNLKKAVTPDLLGVLLARKNQQEQQQPQNALFPAFAH